MPLTIGAIQDDPLAAHPRSFSFALPENAAPGTLLGGPGDIVAPTNTHGSFTGFDVMSGDSRSTRFSVTADGRLAVADGATIDFEALGATRGRIDPDIYAVTAICRPWSPA